VQQEKKYFAFVHGDRWHLWQLSTVVPRISLFSWITYLKWTPVPACVSERYLNRISASDKVAPEAAARCFLALEHAYHHCKASDYLIVDDHSGLLSG
jgi:hypothetical protein